LKQAELNLEWTEVRSPIAGRVSRAAVTVGNLVQEGPPSATLLTTVVSVDPIYAYVDGDEQTYLKYAAFARADAGLINSVATYLWAIRDGYSTALAVEALLQARDLHYAHPHGWQGCQFAQPGFSRSTTRGRSCTPQVATNLTAPD